MCVPAWSLRVCPNHYICVAFPFQSPDKKKVLTTQRTFDSEGEEHSIRSVFTTLLVSDHFASLSSFFKNFNMMDLSVKKKKNCVFQRRSCTRTTRRRPYIMTPMKMPIPENPNLITASWCSTDLFAPPGASSVWSVIILTSFSLFLYIQCTDKHTAHTVRALSVSWNASALKNAVISSLATAHTHPPTVSTFLCRSLCLSGNAGAFLLGLGWAGRQTVSQTHRKSWKHCWA